MEVGESVETAVHNGGLTAEEAAEILERAGLDQTSSSDEDVAAGDPAAWYMPAGAEATSEELEARGLNPDEDEVPSRRSVEALLAAADGQPEAEWKAEHAGTPWGELYDRLDAHETLRVEYALDLEADYARIEAERGSLDHLAPAPLADDVGDLVAKAPPGAQSGALEDYTRAELCKRLGYLQRDAKDWSDDDLRAMCVDAGQVPRFKGSPSHATLAAERANRYYGETRRRSAFQKAMRMPYSQLNPSEGDTSKASWQDETLRRTNPLLARTQGASRARAVGQAQALANRVPEAYTPAPGAQTRAVSSLEHRFGDAFRGMGQRFGGMYLTGVHGHGSSGTWRQVARGVGNCWGFYRPSTGEIHLNPRIDKLISKAQVGKADPQQIYQAAHTLAHECFHACSDGRGAGGGASRGTSHTVEEGGTEALARLHTDRLARDMKLWSDDEPLSRHAGAESASYPTQTETMVALSAVCTGEMIAERLKVGGYREPTDLSPAAQEFLTKLHTETPLHARPAQMASTIAEKHGIPEQDARTLVNGALNECSKPRYKSRIKETVKVGEDGRLARHREYVRPASLSEGLAETLRKVSV